MSDVARLEADRLARSTALDPTRSFIVQAPAGSGKTELLTQRFLKLLTQNVQAPEEIIAITFTRKAAAEMRHRILQALERAQTQPEPETAHQKLTWQLAKAALKISDEKNWRLIQNPNRLRILTIDALCARLNAQMPLLSRTGLLPQLTEDAQPLYALAAERLLLRLSDNPPWRAAMETLLAHLDNRIQHLHDLFTRMLSQRDQWLPHLFYHAGAPDVLRQALELGLQRIAQEAMNDARGALQAYEGAAQTLLVYAQRHLNQIDFVWDETNIAHWKILADLFLTQTGTYRKTIDKRQGFPAASSLDSPEAKATAKEMKALFLECVEAFACHDGILHALQAIQHCPPQHYSAEQWRIIEALTDILPLLAAQLQLIFHEKQTMDFIELNLGALRALGEPDAPTELALYLDYHIQHCLIDEFQDTSLTQYTLLHRLTAGWEAQDGRTLFLVGDPMQSIYRFRNAEVGLFLRAQQHGIGTIPLTPLSLTRNFRSQATLVEWFNETFSNVFPSYHDIASGAVPYSPAVATVERTPDQVRFVPLLAGTTQAEAARIAEHIQQIKHASPEDSIAILVRSRAQLRDILPALRDASLAFQAIAIETLDTCVEIEDLLTLTRAMHHLADSVSWLSLLRAPWCGLTLSDLLVLAQAAKQKPIWTVLRGKTLPPALSADGLARLHMILPALHQAFALRGRTSDTQWLKSLWIALDGAACLQNSNQLNNAFDFFNLLEALEQQHHAIPLDQLDTAVGRLYAEPSEKTEHAIQVMTIHKSKGLEFDHVILPGLQDKTAPNPTQLLRWLDRPNSLDDSDLILAPIKSTQSHRDALYDYLNGVEQDKLRYEMARLLYVALTRAKKSLLLTARLQADPDEPNTPLPANPNSFLALLETAFHATPVAIHANAEDVVKRPLDMPAEPTLMRVPLRAQPTTMLTPADQAIRQFDIHPTLNGANHVGTLLHEILADVAKRPIDLAATLAQEKKWHTRLRQLGLFTDTAEPIAFICTTLTRVLQDPRAQWILSHAHQDAECELALTLPSEHGVKHLVIDRTFIDEAGTRWIIDYKTGQTDPTEHYPQLQAYAHALKDWSSHPIQLGLYFLTTQVWHPFEMSTAYAPVTA